MASDLDNYHNSGFILDETLKAIISPWAHKMTDDVVEQIKQAFKGYLSGQEWYGRFEKELKDVDWWRTEATATEYNVLLTAKCAADLES